MCPYRWKKGWQGSVTLNGERKRKNFQTKREAEDWEHWIHAQAQQGYSPFERKISFLDFSKTYLEFYNARITIPGQEPFLYSENNSVKNFSSADLALDAVKDKYSALGEIKIMQEVELDVTVQIKDTP